ncbi:hypothetical protein EYC84_009639 [Monilinia fructicola]|uniref:Uncharacterized protein n=1 Tax=Monilinia fructicola TaxID=38448 RepID=A0A5M9JDQ4_MONFR|nr:hypothetical protein EYC84_009639 [Monilinia fructicola]
MRKQTNKQTINHKINQPRPQSQHTPHPSSAPHRTRKGTVSRPRSPTSLPPLPLCFACNEGAAQSSYLLYCTVLYCPVQYSTAQHRTGSRDPERTAAVRAATSSADFATRYALPGRFERELGLDGSWHLQYRVLISPCFRAGGRWT